jgi:hypothetical protein
MIAAGGRPANGGERGVCEGAFSVGLGSLRELSLVVVSVGWEDEVAELVGGIERGAGISCEPSGVVSGLEAFIRSD